MFMPDDRAVGGRKERNSRADLARVEKGLKRVVTSVMNRVIMVGGVWSFGRFTVSFFSWGFLILPRGMFLVGLVASERGWLVGWFAVSCLVS